MTKHDNKTAEELILDNAPKGMFTAVYNNYSSDWLYSNQCNLRSLADIKALIAKDKRIADLEKKLFTQENEANKAALRACNMLVDKDERIAELERDQDLLRRSLARKVIKLYNLENIAERFMEDCEEICELLLANGDAANLIAITNDLKRLGADCEKALNKGDV